MAHREFARPDVAESFDARRLTLWQAWAAKLPRNAFVGRQLEAATAR